MQDNYPRNTVGKFSRIYNNLGRSNASIQLTAFKEWLCFCQQVVSDSLLKALIIRNNADSKISILH
jgi:hypothetical protein